MILIFALLLMPTTYADTAQNVHKVRQESFWTNYKSQNLEQKLVPATPEVIDYLIQDNIKNGWPNRPKPASLSEEFRKDIINALKELPPNFIEKINPKLTAIMVVEDLGGSAYTEDILSSNGNRVAGFIILDISALNRKANEWATWKENTPFQADPKVHIIAEIESSKDDNRKNALQFIMLHEFGHILSIGNPAVAPWGEPKEIGSFAPFKFTALSWKIEQEKVKSLFDDSKLNRKDLRYYANETVRLPSTRAATLYGQLKGTNFPSLYAATNPYDDFAESVATYVHTIQMKRPWRIQIRSKEKTILNFEMCWKEPRCREKRKALEEILK